MRWRLQAGMDSVAPLRGGLPVNCKGVFFPASAPDGQSVHGCQWCKQGEKDNEREVCHILKIFTDWKLLVVDTSKLFICSSTFWLQCCLLYSSSYVALSLKAPNQLVMEPWWALQPCSKTYWLWCLKCDDRGTVFPPSVKFNSFPNHDHHHYPY